MVEFYKYHAIGNDYIVIDPNICSISITRSIIQSICNRHRGVGADGVLWGPIIENNKISFKIYNSDGSEAERSGNGIRIFAQYAFDKQYVKEKIFDLYTLSSVANIHVLEEGMISVLMGSYNQFCRTYHKHEFQVDDQLLEGHYLDVGNPHCVFFMKTIDSEKIKKIGPIISNHQIFPNKTNVQIARILDSKSLELQVWERGSGYTLASGTSSVAASCIAYMLSLSSSDVTVHMPGGSLFVRIDKEKVFLTGPTVMVAHGFFIN
jgi:diaminopimelate epimerase